MVAPAGHVSLARARLRAMLADSAAFRSWTGTADFNAALAKTFLDAAPGGAARPFVTIELERGSLTTGFTDELDNDLTETRGTLLVRFQSPIAGGTADPDENALVTFENQLGAIWADLETLAGTRLSDGADALRIEDPIELVSPAARPERLERQGGDLDFFLAALRVKFRAVWP